jgi:hypothetical protein
MNEELTNEMLEVMKKCSFSCALCDANGVCDKYDWQDTIQTLATALLEERAKPKVWDGAPDEADYVTVGAYKNSNPLAPIKVKCYTRELPKSRARQIAEAEGHGLAEKYGWNAAAKELVTNVMESALNRYAEELEGMKEAPRKEKEDDS